MTGRVDYLRDVYIKLSFSQLKAVRIYTFSHPGAISFLYLVSEENALLSLASHRTPENHPWRFEPVSHY